MSSDPVLSDGVGVLLGRESAIGVSPTVWQQVQINPGGITDWTRANTESDRNPLSPNLTPEAGEVVGYDTSPKLAGDLTRDLLNMIREPMFRSLTKHAGGQGQSRYDGSGGVSATGFTVTSLGALAAGTLIKATGFSIPGNNGPKVVTAGSTGIEIKAAGLAIEAPSAANANAIVEIAGFQGAAGDIELVAGNLFSTVVDFTTWGLIPGQMIVIGDATSGAAFAFATAAYNAGAIVAGPITAHSIPLMMREWTVAGDDIGAAKTIRVLFCRAIRNVPMTDGDYLKAPTLGGEISENIAGAPDYTYGGGLGLKTVEIDIPVEGKVGCTMSFVGMTMSDPGTVRAAGAATALAPLQTGLFQTAGKMTGKLVKKADESTLSVDINGMKITFENNITPMKEIFVSGAAGLIYGAYGVSMSIQVYLITNDMTRAANGNTDGMYRTRVKNADGGFGIFVPLLKLRKPAKAYAAHTAVMLSNDIAGFRDPATGLMQVLSEFSYLP